ncbi:putative beta-lysine N-acetyltransferase [Saccharicrinis fermentans DSM 9555 = JCM 21142]|uniref:Putative beta-lysine N-acetyltransferase n=2 Tax=Saccharicrinis fermentans TaxID=982 RepID=W7YL59_9BACT|nr:putative beta-lysine N-acetyltransferase [Saccharicrinis fermentans DSM 9555 = JCM 21142]
MNNDIIEEITEGSLIQHGKGNDRVYLMSLKGNPVLTIQKIQQLASLNKYSKLFCKVPKSAAPVFFANGFLLEAFIPKFYSGKEDVFFVSKFLNADRLLNIENKQLIGLNKLLVKQPTKKKIPKGYKARTLNTSDVQQITKIYQDVFTTYPFPIHEPDYIIKTMDENLQYYGVEYKGKLVALSAAEIDLDGKNAEMTDFATHFSHQGNNLSSVLLEAMEKTMKKQGIKTVYTIARLNSIPMNLTFLRFAYEYSGTLIKNTNIGGQIESMNVYYKHL